MENTIRNHVEILSRYGNRISISISPNRSPNEDGFEVVFNYLSGCEDSKIAAHVLRVLADRLESQQNAVNEAKDILNDKNQ